MAGIALTCYVAIGAPEGMRDKALLFQKRPPWVSPYFCIS